MVRPRDTVRHLKVLRSQKRAWFSWRVHYLKVRVICFKEFNLFEKKNKILELSTSYPLLEAR